MTVNGETPVIHHGLTWEKYERISRNVYLRVADKSSLKKYATVRMALSVLTEGKGHMA